MNPKLKIWFIKRQHKKDYSPDINLQQTYMRFLPEMCYIKPESSLILTQNREETCPRWYDRAQKYTCFNIKWQHNITPHLWSGCPFYQTNSINLFILLLRSLPRFRTLAYTILFRFSFYIAAITFPGPAPVSAVLLGPWHHTLQPNATWQFHWRRSYTNMLQWQAYTHTHICACEHALLMSVFCN